MILSERHNFVFIKGMKVAGTSIEMALSTICGPQDIVTPLSPVDELARGGLCRNYAADREAEADYLRRLRAAAPGELGTIMPAKPVFYNHMPLTQVMQSYKGSKKHFQIVCAERSPYAKVISLANMRLTYENYLAGGEMRAEVKDIQAYIDKAFQMGKMDALNIERYRRPDGKVRLRVLRYETLEADLGAFLKELGEAAVPYLPHAKKGLMSDTLDPRAVLRPDQIATINTVFAEEFDTFGYPRL